MRFVALVVLFLLANCSSEDNSKKKEKDKTPVKDGVVRTHYPNGKVKTEVTVQNGKRNGKALEYYADGRKMLEINYVDGKNSGLTTRYYQNGNVFEETMYENGKMHGIRKKYRENGKLSTEASYHYGQPCAGLKEYLVDGKPKTNYPTIVIQPIDRILKDGKYILRLSMSDNSKGVKFYRGELSNNCFKEELEYADIPSVGAGVSELVIDVPPGSFMMNKINIVAKQKTALGNYYVAQRSHNLAIENR